jgi:hypothetical protein
MGLGDVNNQKSNSMLILLEQIVEGGNLPSERRSRVTAEHQHYRLLLIQGRELN